MKHTIKIEGLKIFLNNIYIGDIVDTNRIEVEDKVTHYNFNDTKTKGTLFVITKEAFEHTLK